INMLRLQFALCISNDESHKIIAITLTPCRPKCVRPSHPPFISFIRWLYKKVLWMHPIRGGGLHRMGSSGMSVFVHELATGCWVGKSPPFPIFLDKVHHRIDGGRQSTGQGPVLRRNRTA